MCAYDSAIVCIFTTNLPIVTETESACSKAPPYLYDFMYRCRLLLACSTVDAVLVTSMWKDCHSQVIMLPHANRNDDDTVHESNLLSGCISPLLTIIRKCRRLLARAMHAHVSSRAFGSTGAAGRSQGKLETSNVPRPFMSWSCPRSSTTDT